MTGPAAVNERGAGAGPVLGIVGGGQLARMLAEAASPLGIRIRVLAGAGDEGAPEVVPDVVIGSPDDPDALRAFAATVDVVTFDHENVDHDALASVEASGTLVHPPVRTLRFADKAHQRNELAAAGIPVPPFAVVDPSAGDVAATVLDFADRHGGRIVVKASRGGYDGRGVWILGRDELPEFLDSYEGAPLVLEPVLDLVQELAVLVARRPSGDLAVWPVVETVQVDGQCNEVLLPAPVDAAVARRAAEIGEQVARATGAVGVFAVELFVTGGPHTPDVLVNEIAPRVHNSGHLTIEGCATSQFEQHLRAVLDWPLGPTDPVAPAAAMANVLGGPAGDPRDRQAEALTATPGAHVHLYGKTSRPARKVGHVTVVGDDLAACRRDARRAADVLGGVDGPPA